MMTRRRSSWLWISSLVMMALPIGVTADDQLPKPLARRIDFVKEVQPIFEAKCLGCHGAKKQESAFRLD
ncbi:MAG: hypothetical protein FJ302_00060 [Planctomycetes bacterium]|nr:hypothetical protein [Planctomycetota bacterium]